MKTHTLKTYSVTLNDESYCYLENLLLRDCKSSYDVLYTNYKLFINRGYKDTGFNLVDNIRNKEYLRLLRQDLMRKIHVFQSFTSKKVEDFFPIKLDLFSFEWFDEEGATAYVHRKYDYIPNSDK